MSRAENKQGKSTPLAHRKLGDRFFALGRYAEAVDAYQQPVALDPEDVAARQGLEAARSRAP